MTIEFRFIATVDAYPKIYRKIFCDAVVFTHTGALLLQRRPAGWGSSAGKLTLFGGHAESGEKPITTICRELNEELGGSPIADDVICIGVIEEHEDSHCDAVYIHIWHDLGNTITGCYEGNSEAYSSIADALLRDDIMPYARLALEHAQTFLKPD